jgi:hypothetical protein
MEDIFNIMWTKIDLSYTRSCFIILISFKIPTFKMYTDFTEHFKFKSSLRWHTKCTVIKVIRFCCLCFYGRGVDYRSTVCLPACHKRSQSNQIHIKPLVGDNYLTVLRQCKQPFKSVLFILWSLAVSFQC